jgi:hypothetical protein
VLDPFANRIVFHQLVEEVPTEGGGTAAGPIEHEYDVACSPAHAFAVYTGEIDSWWPDGYSPPGKEHVLIEPGVGGACTMLLADGTAYPWGRVAAWEPPGHFAMDFTLAQDPDHPSRIDVWFDQAGEGRTRLRFSHGGWNAGNVAGRARFSEWPIILDRFVAWAEGRPLAD